MRTRTFLRYIILVGVCVLVYVGWLNIKRSKNFREAFEALQVPVEFKPESMDPAALFKQARTLLERYDKPEVWNRAAQTIDLDPGQLARLQLGIQN